MSESGKAPAKRQCNALRNLAVTSNQVRINQIIKLQEDISALEATIAVQECEMNDLTYSLFKLTRAGIPAQ